MSVGSKALLAIDAGINLALGALLLFFPAALVSALGIPGAESSFYPSILGAVLFGIGVALWIQRRSPAGLGLAGAIAINLCGALALAGWLLFGSLSLPERGFVTLWSLVAVLMGLSAIEWLRYSRGRAA